MLFRSTDSLAEAKRVARSETKSKVTSKLIPIEFMNGDTITTVEVKGMIIDVETHITKKTDSRADNKAAAREHIETEIQVMRRRTSTIPTEEMFLMTTNVASSTSLPQSE